MRRFMCSKGFLKIQLFHRYFKKDFVEKFQNAYWEKYTCLKFRAVFRKIVIIALVRNTPNNKFLDVTNKETKKVTWHCCWSVSIMNLEQLIFTWHFPVDTGRKLNVHKTFRRCPGRLLNVLCTFNLRPVSTGL